MNIPRKGNRALLMGLAFVACLSVPAESTYAVDAAAAVMCSEVAAAWRMARTAAS